MAQAGTHTVSAVSRSVAKAVLTFPISPRVFAGGVSALRRLHLLPKETANAAGPVNRIFISHPYSSIGDLVLLIPLLERVRQEWPGASIDVAVGERVADLLCGVSGLRRIIRHPSDPAGIPHLQNYSRAIRLLRTYRRQMMQSQYDLAIAPRWGAIDTWPAIYLAYLTGATRRIGYSATIEKGDTRLDALLTDAAFGGSNEHETARSLKLLSRVGLVEARVDDDQTVNDAIPSLVTLSRQLQAGEGASLHSREYAIVSPGATAAFRIWPPAQMGAAIRTLRQQTGVDFFIVGSGNDASLCEEVVRLSSDGSISLAGKTNILELVTLLAGAKFFLGMDSGTAHLAGALGIPTVVISPFPAACSVDHPNSPLRFRPCGPQVRVLQPEHALPPCDPTCSFSEPHCIRQISPEAVIWALVSILRRNDGTNAKTHIRLCTDQRLSC